MTDQEHFNPIDRPTDVPRRGAGPYRNLAGALLAIRYAGEHGVPFPGTCTGFQHALLEARATYSDGRWLPMRIQPLMRAYLQACRP